MKTIQSILQMKPFAEKQDCYLWQVQRLIRDCMDYKEEKTTGTRDSFERLAAAVDILNDLLDPLPILAHDFDMNKLNEL